MQLQGRTALITGGASGLGNATAHVLTGAGMNVVLVDLPGADGDARAAELGDAALWAPADVTDSEQVEEAIAITVERFGRLDVAVNCAGVAPAQKTVGRSGPHDLDVFARTVQVNLVGTFNVIRLAAARMASQDPDGDERGVIVNTASIAAFDGQMGQAAYAASKAGIVGLTLPVARDLARELIRVVTIAPGTFDTPMLAGMPQDAKDALAADIPHPHRLGAPSEFGLLVRQIAENPYLNGEVIRLDGGLRMKAR